jgi:hypothetical protein
MSDLRRMIPRLGTASLALGLASCSGGDDVNDEPVTGVTVARDYCEYFQNCDPADFASTYGSLAECTTAIQDEFAYEFADLREDRGQACYDATLDYYHCYYARLADTCSEPSPRACESEGLAAVEACTDVGTHAAEIEALATEFCQEYKACSPYFMEYYTSLSQCISCKKADIGSEFTYYAEQGEACAEAALAHASCEIQTYSAPDCSYVGNACDAEQAAAELACPEYYGGFRHLSPKTTRTEAHRPRWLRDRR